jgi:hypothetical protein
MILVTVVVAVTVAVIDCHYYCDAKAGVMGPSIIAASLSH